MLLNILPLVPDISRGMLDFGSRLTVTGVIYRLIRSLKELDAIETSIGQIIPSVGSLLSQPDLIDIVGYRENRGHKLVSEAAAEHLEKDWRDRVRSTPEDVLAKEDELLRILHSVKTETKEDEPAFKVGKSPITTRALLKSAWGETQGQAFGSRAVRRSPRLAWDAVVGLYGDEKLLREALDKLRQVAGLEDGELLALADKYLAGWWPDKFENFFVPSNEPSLMLLTSEVWS